jgi:hypothetical protein
MKAHDDSEAVSERVSLIEEEFVAARGSARVVWLVKKNDGWVRAGSAPGAVSERLSSGPGIVWRTRVELSLPRGTHVVRVETRPEPRPTSTMEHLTGGAPGRKREITRRQLRRVAAGGVLEPVDERA